MRLVLSFLFYGWGNWGMQQATSLYKVTQGVSSRVRVCIQLDSRVHALTDCAALKDKGKASRCINQWPCVKCFASCRLLCVCSGSGQADILGVYCECMSTWEQHTVYLEQHLACLSLWWSAFYRACISMPLCMLCMWQFHRWLPRCSSPLCVAGCIVKRIYVQKKRIYVQWEN